MQVIIESGEGIADGGSGFDGFRAFAAQVAFAARGILQFGFDGGDGLGDEGVEFGDVDEIGLAGEGEK